MKIMENSKMVIKLTSQLLKNMLLLNTHLKNLTLILKFI